jgi:osmotically-inducible protein OsmY
LVADPDVVRVVADALAQDERTAAYVLRVEARHGVATLRGEVPSEAVQDAAVAIAASVPLVASVRNLTTVGGDPRPAVALPRSADLAIAANTADTQEHTAEAVAGAHP